MPVYDQSYKRWEGSFKSRSFCWWVISKYGIRTAFKKRAVRVLFVFALLQFLASAVYIYGLTNIMKVSTIVQALAGGRGMPQVSPRQYRAEIDGNMDRFLEELQRQDIPWQANQQGLKMFLPEGETSKNILAIAQRTGTNIARLIPPGVKASFYNTYLNRQFLFLFLLLLAVGTALIAKDVKFNALQIYLAKPITGIDYILGKLGIVLFFLLMVTAVPGLLLFFLQAILIGDSLYLRHYWWVLATIPAYSLVVIFSGALLVLALSALSRNVRTAAFGAAALFWFSPMVAQLLWRSTWNENYLLLSFPHNWKRVGEKIFGMSGTTDVGWGWSLLIVAVIMLLCSVVLARRVRAVNVVK